MRKSGVSLSLVVLCAFAFLGLVSCPNPLVSTTANPDTTTNDTTNNSSNGGTFTVVGQVNGQVVDDLGKPVPGATVLYDAPEATISKAISRHGDKGLAKGITTVTTDSNGYFTIINLQTGGYVFTVMPPTTTSAGVTTVNNAAGTFAQAIPTLAVLTQFGSAAGYPSGTNNSSNRTYVTTQQVVLPRLLGSITGILLQNSATNSAPPVAVPKGTTLTMDFGSAYVLSNSYGQINQTTGIPQPATVALLYPAYNSTTKAIGTSTFVTTTTSDANGDFSFTSMPLTVYGGSSNGIPGSSTNWILVDLGLGKQVSPGSGGLAVASLPLIPLGYQGSTPSMTLTSPLYLSYSGYPALALVSTSTTDTHGNTGNNPATTAPIILTFSNPVLATLPSNPLTNSPGPPSWRR